MTTPIKTQCPHCHACFKVKQTQLNKVNTTVSCDHCQQSFLVNKHLIVTTDTPNTSPTQTDITTTFTPDTGVAQPSNTHHKVQKRSSNAKSLLSKPATKKCSSDQLIHDDLIHDDMDIDEPADPILEYDSLDSMEAWLTQASNASRAASTPSNMPSKKSVKNSRSSVNPTPSAPLTEPSSSAQVALSSAAANDIHASVDEAADNAWLEALLKEQNKSAETPQDDTDLSQLLLDMGVSLKDEDGSADARARQAQASTAPPSENYSVASVLWSLGCLVLALLLFAQYVIFNLETLVKDPVYAQRLHALCSIAACSLPNADLGALTVTDLNHQPSQIKVTGAFSDVSATLHNQSTKAQLYPNIKVSVYGTNNLIGEFIAAPNDYLLSKQNQLAADSGRQLLFTIPVANTNIREVTATPLY